jgi:DNA (cytosine-5)-methyltransferase 1
MEKLSNVSVKEKSTIKNKIEPQPHFLKKENKFTFIDLFAGIGGFHIASKNAGGKCVFACEIDKSARETYKKNHKILDNIFTEDVTKVESSNVPNHDVLCAGFPCQPFSQAGFKKGFADIRGTLFFDIVRIIDEKRPKAMLLENVQHLLKHDEGKTFAKIKEVITKELGYSFYYKILRASDFGVPQNRPRLFMVGFRDDKTQSFSFPSEVKLETTMSDILEGKCEKKIGYTLRVGGRGSKINDRRNWDSYLVDGEVKRISSKEGLLMQGFPEDFFFPVSETQAMKQLGNSVAVPVVKAVIDKILDYLTTNESK